MALVTRYLLHSGGLDSHVAWLLDPTRVPVYIRHGASNERHEIEALRGLVKWGNFSPRYIHGPDIGRWAAPDGHVRHRNLVLLACVASLSDAEEVAYAAVRGEASADKSPQFVASLARTLHISERDTTLVAPLARLTKAQALARAVELGDTARRQLDATRSCYSHYVLPCGECQACYRRALAYWTIGLRDLPPPLPKKTDGAFENLRRTPVRRWPDLARANVPAARAMWARRRVGLRR